MLSNTNIYLQNKKVVELKKLKYIHKIDNKNTSYSSYI